MFIIRYERKTQPMKKILSLSPILLTLTWIIVLSVLVGCTTVGKTISSNSSDNSHTYSSQNVVYNVYYTYDFSSKYYLVVIEDKEYRVPPKNYYNIKIDEWSYTEEHRLIYNEFYSGSLELFVYYRK